MNPWKMVETQKREYSCSLRVAGDEWTVSDHEHEWSVGATRKLAISDLSAFFAAQTPEDQQKIREAVGCLEPAEHVRKLEECVSRLSAMEMAASFQAEGFKRELENAQRDLATAKESAQLVEGRLAEERNRYQQLEAELQSVLIDRDEWKAHAESFAKIRGVEYGKPPKEDELDALRKRAKKAESDLKALRDVVKAGGGLPLPKLPTLSLPLPSAAEHRLNQLTLALGAERVAELLGEKP